MVPPLANRLTRHASSRMRQRALSADDVSIVRQYGLQTPNGFLMTRKGIAARKAELKRELQRLDKLDGVVVIEDQESIVTVYRASPKRAKKERKESGAGL